MAPKVPRGVATGEPEGRWPWFDKEGGDNCAKSPFSCPTERQVESNGYEYARHTDAFEIRLGESGTQTRTGVSFTGNRRGQMLTSLSIKNFRSCENVALDLSDPIVALVGKNGSGKTNLLHAIQLAADSLAGEPDSLYGFRPRNPGEPVVLELGFELDDVGFSYRVSRSGRPSLQQHQEQLVAGGDVLFSRQDQTVQLLGEGVTNELRIGLHASATASLLQLLPDDNPLLARLWAIHSYVRSIRYYPLIQNVLEHALGTPPRSIASDALIDGNPLIDVARYDAWKAELAAGRAKSGVIFRILHLFLTDPDRFAELSFLLGNSGLCLVSEIDIREIRLPRPARDQAEEVNEKAYTVTFAPSKSLAGAGRSFTYRGLSAGTWRVIQLVTYLIFDQSSCMLIEQPEDSIHPGLLSKVVDLLRAYADRTQLICTTHSPRVLNAVGSAGVRLVTAIDGVTRVTQLSHQQQESAHEYIRDEGTLAEYLDTL